MKKLILAALLGGCAYGWNNLHNGAAHQFAKSYQCPLDRVAAAQRPLNLAPPPVPPDDVAKDPGRLEIWKKQQADQQGKQKDQERTEVTGCDHDAMYLCSWASFDQEGQQVDYASCSRENVSLGLGVYFVPGTLKVDDGMHLAVNDIGLLRGDVVVAIDQKPMHAADEIDRLLPAGKHVVSITRDGKPVDIAVDLH